MNRPLAIQIFVSIALLLAACEKQQPALAGVYLASDSSLDLRSDGTCVYLSANDTWKYETNLVRILDRNNEVVAEFKMEGKDLIGVNSKARYARVR